MRPRVIFLPGATSTCPRLFVRVFFLVGEKFAYSAVLFSFTRTGYLERLITITKPRSEREFPCQGNRTGANVYLFKIKDIYLYLFVFIYLFVVFKVLNSAVDIFHENPENTQKKKSKLTLVRGGDSTLSEETAVEGGLQNQPSE